MSETRVMWATNTSKEILDRTGPHGDGATLWNECDLIMSPNPVLVTSIPDGVEPPPEWLLAAIRKCEEIRHRPSGELFTPVSMFHHSDGGAWRLVTRDELIWIAADFEPIPTEPDVLETWEESKVKRGSLGREFAAMKDAGDALAARVRELEAEVERRGGEHGE